MRWVMALAALLAAREAAACTLGGCERAAFLPEGGRIPANAPAIVWKHSFNFGSYRPRATLRLQSDGTDLVVVPSSEESSIDEVALERPLEPGKSYRLQETDGCEDGGATFTATAPAPLPTTLGTLVVGKTTIGDLQLGGGGSCAETVSAAQAGMSLDFSPEAEPWRELLTFRTIVDGEPWTPSHLVGFQALGGGWEGRGNDLFYAVCGSRYGGAGSQPHLAEGPHEVWMEASLPGTAISVRTLSWRIDLRCDGEAEDPRPMDAPAGCATAAVGAWALLGVLSRRQNMNIRSRFRPLAEPPTPV